MSLLQFSRYSVAPARRSLLLAMLEERDRERATPQLIGAFRDLDDECGVICLHVLTGHGGASVELERFHRDALVTAQASVQKRLLLGPGWEEAGLVPAPRRPAAARRGHVGVVEVCLVQTTAAVDVIDLMYFCDEVAPLIQAAAGTVLASSPLTATSGSWFRPIYLVSERAGCLDGGADR